MPKVFEERKKIWKIDQTLYPTYKRYDQKGA